MRETSRYIDPATGSYVYEDGEPRTVSAALGRTGLILLTATGTVPGSDALTCRLRSLRTPDPRRAEAEVDRALRKHQTRPGAPGLFDSYTRRAWVSGRVMWVSVTIVNAGAASEYVAALA